MVANVTSPITHLSAILVVHAFSIALTVRSLIIREACLSGEVRWTTLLRQVEVGEIRQVGEYIVITTRIRNSFGRAE